MKKNLTAFYLLTFLMLIISSVGVRADTCIEHQWGDWTEEWAATCIKDGSRYHTCQICNTTERETIPATGNHTWGEWQKLSGTSCLKESAQRRFCKDCPASETNMLPAIGHHTWEEWHDVLKPTCIKNGKKERTCSVCYEIEEKEIPKTRNHSWEKWEVTKRATALSNGTKTRYCSECYKKNKKSIPKLKAKISLKKKSVTVKSGKSYTIKIKSKTYGDKVKKWRSSNKKVAIVNSKGKVTGKRAGVATITLEMKSKVRATCKVKVTKPATQPTQTINPNPVATPNPPPAQPASVWLSETGDKYHSIPNCGRMNPSRARQVSLSEAQRLGYPPCSKCF